MKKLNVVLVASYLFVLGTTIQAQNAIPASGGNASGSGGSVSFTIGQVVYSTITGSNGSSAQGVQQPCEISVITSIKNTERITLEVFPNPTRGIIKLVVGIKDLDNMSFHLYDLSGIRIQDKKIDNEETEIPINSFKPSVYFLKVLRDNKEIKTFKIIKY
jgi:hypothetical protein